MSADPQTVVCSMTECEKVQNLLRSYTHILTKESEKVISRITDIRGDVEDTLASRKTLTGDIRLWERNMIAAVHAEAERCINDLNVQADLQLTKLRDLEEQLQTLLMTLNEVCLKLNILTIQTFTENNMEHTVRSIRNNIKMELEKLCFPDQFNATKLCLVPNITPGQSLVNIRKCPLLLDENKQNIFHPVSIEKTISLGKTIKSRVSGDTFYPMIGDIAVVPPDNVIVVCDWKNQCLKSFYKSYYSRLAMSFKSPCLSSELQAEVDCVPWHLAAISDNTVAVTTNHHQILLVDVWPSLALKSRIPVNQFYHGIRLVNESSLAVSYNKNSNIVVDIVSHEGRVVHTINTGVVGDVWNTCMDVSSDEDVLIGSRSCGVSCFSQQNVVKWVFPGPNGRNLKPVSVCSIGADRFIAVDRSGRVVCINSVSAETTVLVSKLSGVIEPTCVYVTSSLLCLAEWRSGKIKLFNIDMNKK